MSQYGQRKSSRQPSNSKTGRNIMMIFIGMLVGLLIAVGVAFYISNLPIPFLKPRSVDQTLVNQSDNVELPLIVEGGDNVSLTPDSDIFGPPPEVLSSQFEDDFADEEGAAPAPSTAAAPESTPTTAPTPSAPPETAMNNNQYDFYNLLPSDSTHIASTAPTPPPAVLATPDRYYLQAGAFANAQDADNLKATLALTGVEANIQTIIGPNNRSIHRVRVGPFNSQQEAEAVQRQMASSRVSADIIKVSP